MTRKIFRLCLTLAAFRKLPKEGDSDYGESRR